MEIKYRFTFSSSFDNSNDDSGYSFNYVVRLFEGENIEIVESGVFLDLTIQQCIDKQVELTQKYK